MASFLDRIRYANDWDTDGGEIESTIIANMIDLYAGGGCSAAHIKAQFNCTTEQGNQLDEILAARPAAPVLFLGVPAYVQWATKLSGAFRCAQFAIAPITTDAALKAAIGI